MTATKKDGEKEITSGSCILAGNNFRIDGEGRKEEGRLVLKMPPPNAKGPVIKGLLFNGRFYQQSSH